ncbi:hypothetical protein DY124_07620 [Apilactobacillus micheneri]|uniref:hypothetical protein n=1 Tax=Apilactobacillus micheneri TaxID=1899430 RepID=UPI00112B4844|nr:hypothetical protein [Apilactobacillus micheneri]TPR42365.1 hypothetical protein DY124_07620 [Apilactobacillus micheneri]TPR47085.1 hypothetical protein DY125_07545 [Apilactobacillus micheneri]
MKKFFNESVDAIKDSFSSSISWTLNIISASSILTNHLYLSLFCFILVFLFELFNEYKITVRIEKFVKFFFILFKTCGVKSVIGGLIMFTMRFMNMAKKTIIIIFKIIALIYLYNHLDKNCISIISFLAMFFTKEEYYTLVNELKLTLWKSLYLTVSFN